MPDPTYLTRDTYQQIAPAYAERRALHVEGLDELIDTFAALLPAGAEVADIGCGPGIESRLLRRRGLRVIGLDLSEAMLRQGDPGALVVADMRALPLADASLDGVWCQAALLHLTRADVPRALAEFARVLRPAGALHLLIAEGEAEGWEPAQMYGSDLRRWYTYHREDAMTAMLAQAGFAITDIARWSSNRDWLRLRTTRRVPDLEGGPPHVSRGPE